MVCSTANDILLQTFTALYSKVFFLVFFVSNPRKLNGLFPKSDPTQLKTEEINSISKTKQYYQE